MLGVTYLDLKWAQIWTNILQRSRLLLGKTHGGVNKFALFFTYEVAGQI